MNIDWQSNETYLLLNPRLPQKISLGFQQIQAYSNKFPAHIWLTTSGSNQLKLVALHKKAILSSAQSVNQHLKATSKDIWINPLPIFHVGGLGIWARAHLSGAALFPFLDKWSPQKFHTILEEHQATLTSLVPAQVYDLVINQLKCPKSLRALVVGGGALGESLYHQARLLGWPLLPSYGLTECASQVATATLDSLHLSNLPKLEVLSHIKIKIDENGKIYLSSPALLTTYAQLEKEELQFSTPVCNGWLASEDRGHLMGNTLSLWGRDNSFIKIGGESVEMGRLEKIFEEIKLKLQIAFDLVLLAVPDERLGHAIHLFTTHGAIDTLRKHYDEQVMPYERIRHVHLVDAIPRSPLNKILYNDLLSAKEGSHSSHQGSR